MNKLKLILVLLPWLLLTTQNSYARHAEILVDADNGKILHELEATQSWYPASLTKLMTLYMTFNALNAGQIQLSDAINASSHAARQPNSRLGLRTGDRITVEDALLALITRSANDAAVALAEHLAGTEENFAVKMTAKAHAIGMSDSFFMNATGLPNDMQVTTARDMGLLAWRTLRDFPDYYPYFAATGVFFKGRQLPAINKFTKTYPGAEGMKTGFTCGSGYNLISSASQNGKRLIGVVLGGMTSPQRYQLMISMMNDGFAGSYAFDTGKSIQAPAVMSGSSTPPYQLGCGRHVGVTVASEEDNSNSSGSDSSNETYRPVAHHVRAAHHLAHLPRPHFAPKAIKAHGKPVKVARLPSRAAKAKAVAAKAVARPAIRKVADKSRYHHLTHAKRH
jgi:D-alanyl-D-alanine carboxypeptidase (penicillin-binding protein 5/6)